MHLGFTSTSASYLLATGLMESGWRKIALAAQFSFWSNPCYQTGKYLCQKESTWSQEYPKQLLYCWEVPFLCQHSFQATAAHPWSLPPPQGMW